MTLSKGLAGVAMLAASAIAAAGSVAAQDLKIGIMAVLSGPQAVLGGQLRDGFLLGVKHAGGKLGGLTTTLSVQDDELKHDVAVGKAKQLIERDKVDFVVGPVFSNILLAISKPITEAQVFLISPNAGPSPLAGKGCSPFFFSTSYQNDQPPEVLGKYAQDKGYKKAFLLPPNPTPSSCSCRAVWASTSSSSIGRRGWRIFPSCRCSPWTRRRYPPSRMP